jgi:signal transduction histidine kinase
MPEKVQEKMDEVLDGDVPDSLKFICSSVDRLDRMVNALLGLARMGRQELVLRDVEMTALVNEVCQSFRHQIETNNIHLCQLAEKSNQTGA